MEGAGNYDSSRVISMERTSHQTSQEWIAQRLLSLQPTAPNQVKGCKLASDGFYQLYIFFTTVSAPRVGRHQRAQLSAMGTCSHQQFTGKQRRSCMYAMRVHLERMPVRFCCGNDSLFTHRVIIHINVTCGRTAE
jgi:hypothetical protein